MTPEQELALLQATTAGLDAELRDAFDELIRLINAGTQPREAVAQVMDGFQGEMAQTIAAALSSMLGTAVGVQGVMDLQVGAVRLSTKLYAEGIATGNVVQGIVQRHTWGFQDARQLALELFSGYAQRPPGTEVLAMNPRNPLLPRYLREALLPDLTLAGQMARAFARIQVDGLASQALRAAYTGLLDAIEGMQTARGAVVLEKRLETAFFERMRYFATRIARTELHRTYAAREAGIMMSDEDIEFVQLKRAPGRQLPCICALFTGRDAYGLGPGVYPKAVCPLAPFHPFCACYVKARLDLTGRGVPQFEPNADRYFLQRLGTASIAGRVMGSQARRDLVLNGQSAEAVYNLTQDPQYRLKTLATASPLMVTP